MPHWVFVWTLHDIVGLVVVGLIALFFGALGLLIAIDKLWFKLTGRHL